MSSSTLITDFPANEIIKNETQEILSEGRRIVDAEQFYPTPPELAEKLFNMLDKVESPGLEPSAGEGDLIAAFREFYKYDEHNRFIFDGRTIHIDAIEINADRAAAITEYWQLDAKVIWDNFLTFNPLTPYRTIIMNPPFKLGAYHLLKAIDILAPNGQIACILNAETIKNPYSRARKELIKRLENDSAEYKIEYVQNAFDGVNVEVALIYFRKKPDQNNSVTFDNFKKTVDTIYAAETDNADVAGLTQYDAFAAIISEYRAEVKATLAMYHEAKNFNRIIENNPLCDKDIFDVKFKFFDYGHLGEQKLVHNINKKYWTKLLYLPQLARLLTTDARRNYANKIDKMAEYEFNERNIAALKEDLIKSFNGVIDTAIMKVWETLTHKHSMENPENIHYYNGWKHNKAFKCNNKVIIPLNIFAGNFIDQYYYLDNAAVTIHDIDIAFSYLDNGYSTPYGRVDIDSVIAFEVGKKRETKGIRTDYFTLDFFKKGTCHIKIKSAELLKKFNLYCGKRFNWLPPNYGTKPYNDLTPDEKAVVNEFEGAESYNDTYNNRQFYLTLATPVLPALDAPNE